MKKLMQLFCVAMICTICFQTQAQTPATKNWTSVSTSTNKKAFLDKTQTSMDKFELEMLAEVNEARLTPGKYADYIQKYIDDGKGMGDDKAVAVGLIQDLKNLQKQIDQKKITMHKIEPLDCIFLAARDHAINQAPTGDLNHVDTKSKGPWDRIYGACSSKVPEKVEYPEEGGYTGMSSSRGSNENLEGHSGYKKDNPAPRDANINLLLDSGVKGYGHRRNIIDPNWKYGAFYYYYDEGKDSYGNAQYYFRWIQKYARDKADGKDASNNPMVVLPIQDPDSKTRTTYPDGEPQGKVIDASAATAAMNATEAAAAPKHEGSTASNTSGSSTPTNNTGNTSGSSTPTNDSGNTSGSSSSGNTSGSTATADCNFSGAMSGGMSIGTDGKTVYTINDKVVTKECFEKHFPPQ